MTDYNFFDGYVVKKKKSSVGVRLVNIFFMLFMILLIGYIAFNYYIISSQKSELSDLEQKITEIRATDDIARITEKQELLQQLLEIVADMEVAGDDIQHSSIISEDLLLTIADAMPSDLRINHLSINHINVSLSGESLSKPAIAEFEYNLRQFDSFQNVFVSGINRDTDRAYTFGLSFDVGGDIDED